VQKKRPHPNGRGQGDEHEAMCGDGNAQALEKQVYKSVQKIPLVLPYVRQATNHISYKSIQGGSISNSERVWHAQSLRS
jgi:hypothetical protein